MEQPKRINIGWNPARDYSHKFHDYLKRVGATTVETYVKWIDIEPEPGQITFKSFDRALDHFVRYGVKWQPFLICGPWYATPYWFRESQDSHFFRCLEHNKNSGIQSIWNRNFQRPTRHFLKIFHDHYVNRMDQIDSLLLGISGDYGEAIFPCIGNFDGQYHTHRGFWCNDLAAIKDFRSHCRREWSTIEALNARWGTDYRNFGQVRPFLKKDAPSRRAMVDQVYWYRGAMLNHAEFWMREARRLWPEKDIYLCMGGDGSAEEGQHYAAAADLCAKYNVGIRDTNARDHFRFLNTYQCSTAVGTNFHRTYCGFESSHGSTPEFIVARMFAFIISNAREFHEYSFQGKEEVIRKFRRFRKWMDIRFERKVDVAVFSSQAYVNWVHEHATAWDIKEFPWGLPKPPHDLCDTLRYHFDFDLVNDTLIQANILKNYKVLIVPAFTIIEECIVRVLRGFTARGGQVIVYGGEQPQTVEGQTADIIGATPISTLPALLRRLHTLGIRVKLKKDGTFEAVRQDGKILCYDEKRHRIYWKR